MIVELFDSVSQLDEVIITAFGTTTKKSFTGSASVIKEDDIIKRQTSNITNALVGQVAVDTRFVFRWTTRYRILYSNSRIGSINASNAPLYIVDGIPYDSDISALNNADIESITILKMRLLMLYTEQEEQMGLLLLQQTWEIKGSSCYSGCKMGK